MKNNNSKKVVLVLVLIGAVVAIGFGITVLKPTQEASEPISSIPIESEVGDANTPDAAAESDVESETSNGAGNFEIIQTESVVRFIIGEVLRGEDNLVVGITNQVAGQIVLNIEDPSTSQVGTILVNARTFATDSSFRDRAIKNKILVTDTYEFVTFTPTEIKGWPETIVVGDLIELRIVGDLTILDTTMEVTFFLTVTLVSETRLEGSGFTSVPFADFGIFIPEVPSVTTVDDDVLLEIDFVAELVE